METKQTPAESSGNTPGSDELDVDQIRRDVDSAYDGTLAAVDTLQSGATTSGEAHPGRVATEPEPSNGPSQPTTNPAATEIHKSPEQV